MKHVAWAVVCLAVTAMPVSQARATVWNEATDAGDLPGTADIVTGVGPLNQINGVLPGPDDIDMFLIRITDPNTFSATGTGGLPYGPPRMFLFDVSGVGVSGYFDSTNTGAAVSDTFVGSAGLYYLAYSGFSHPFDANLSGQDLWAELPQDVERAPDGSGAANPVVAWSASIVPYNPTNYTITLTGATYIPEPGTVLLTLAGIAAGVLRRR